jgi:hypothetical protein
MVLRIFLSYLNAAIFFSANERDEPSDLRSSSDADADVDDGSVVVRVVDVEVSGCDVDDGTDDGASIRFDNRRVGKCSLP